MSKIVFFFQDVFRRPSGALVSLILLKAEYRSTVGFFALPPSLKDGAFCNALNFCYRQADFPSAVMNRLHSSAELERITPPFPNRRIRFFSISDDVPWLPKYTLLFAWRRLFCLYPGVFFSCVESLGLIRGAPFSDCRSTLSLNKKRFFF